MQARCVPGFDQCFLKKGYGKGDNREALNAYHRSQVAKAAPEKRLSTSWTFNQIRLDEVERIGNYIRERDPDWKGWTQPWDTGILDDYHVGVDVPA